jgi:hypothetical protein
MSTIEIKKSIRDYINTADEQFLKAVYALMQYDRSRDLFELTPEHEKILEARRKRYKKGLGKSYSWAEVKQRAKSALREI